MRALFWSLAPMPALVFAYLLAPPYVIVGVALASGFFVVLAKPGSRSDVEGHIAGAAV